ncbi:hypothetical protein C8J57DRAFT_1230135 [Mycena rebaudengoi]|nr:hypothetical protein C8J57DRAFT_1230135 [Mycena rebaudengoi]
MLYTAQSDNLSPTSAETSKQRGEIKVKWEFLFKRSSSSMRDSDPPGLLATRVAYGPELKFEVAFDAQERVLLSLLEPFVLNWKHQSCPQIIRSPRARCARWKSGQLVVKLLKKIIYDLGFPTVSAYFSEVTHSTRRQMSREKMEADVNLVNGEPGFAVFELPLRGCPCIKGDFALECATDAGYFQDVTLSDELHFISDVSETTIRIIEFCPRCALAAHHSTYQCGIRYSTHRARYEVQKRKNHSELYIKCAAAPTECALRPSLRHAAATSLPRVTPRQSRHPRVKTSVPGALEGRGRIAALLNGARFVLLKGVNRGTHSTSRKMQEGGKKYAA